VLDARRRGGTRTRTPAAPDVRTGGSEGNRRLTGAAAALLLILLAAEGATLVAIRPLLPLVGVKLASTGYRFARYYTGHRAYRADGPPHALLRALGPFVVIATLALFASGVALVVLGPESGAVLGLHKASFVVWVAAMSAHVLAHVLRVPRLAAADWREDEPLPGSSLRRWLLAGALVAGLILALATVHLAGPWHQFVGLED
jgi:hypothetical protein